MTDLSLKLVRALAKGLSKGRATHVFWGEVASEEDLKGGIVSFFRSEERRVGKEC